MKATASVLLIACSVLGMAHVGITKPHAKPAGLKAHLQKENNIDSAMIKAKDSDGFVARVKVSTTPDFEYVSMGKKENIDGCVAELKEMFQMMDKVKSASATVEKVSSTKDTVTSWVNHRMVYTGMGADGKSHHFVYMGKSKDELRKDGAAWKMFRMTWTDDKILQDGKPMDMTQMQGGASSTPVVDPKDGADGGGPFGKGGGN